MGIIYWREEAEEAYVINSMQGIALEKQVWDDYIACQGKGREVFKQCAADSYDWSLSTVIAYAAYEDNPPPVVVIRLPTPTPVVVTVRVDSKTRKEETEAGAFKLWMYSVKAATDADRSLSYQYSKAYGLRDGTISVAVGVMRGDRFLPRVGFVFHYHPGSKGASVGSTAGSKWHFKPFDGASKWVRVEDYDFVKLDAGMVKEVKRRAKGY